MNDVNGVWIPSGPRARHQALVGPGVPVWSVIGYLHAYGGDAGKVVDIWEGTLSPADVAAAAAYYEEHPEEIDEILREIEEVLTESRLG